MPLKKRQSKDTLSGGLVSVSRKYSTTNKMSSDDFQTKYASFMESMLKSAVAETTKLYETMVDELKAEICKIKKENEDLRTKCSQFENAKSQSGSYQREKQPLPGQSNDFEKCDTAVQCGELHSMLATPS